MCVKDCDLYSQKYQNDNFFACFIGKLGSSHINLEKNWAKTYKAAWVWLQEFASASVHALGCELMRATILDTLCSYLSLLQV
jgi:hypothetical protein